MKKKALTPELLAECSALKNLFVERQAALGLTQEKAAAALGMNQGSFSHYLNGRNALNVDFAAKVAKLLNVPVRAFSPRLTEEIVELAFAHSDNEMIMDVREAVLAARGLKDELEPDDSKPWRMSYRYQLCDWQDERGVPSIADKAQKETGTEHSQGFFSTASSGSSAYWLKVQGPSMYGPVCPSFPEGMLILVQENGFEPVTGSFYLAKNQKGEKIFKRLVIEGSNSYLVSINPSFQAIEMGEDWQIIGKIIDTKMLLS
ncbi:LexA family transcriptional regulator [Pseudomonas sp. DWP3-1-2]|uniref:LexA family transcriptional regulator n=1 Tax=Pseudomonas sp. DWP3-1-2 TaxID=2804645 RepID=UPI003CF3D955